mmetsp:Transcript_15979/g.41067  ORF Transcript_15979/g.41067 Transcript_15979/m.41067 type:complete len:205 (+) Transcript_15979:1109-1723(+)
MHCRHRVRDPNRRTHAEQGTQSGEGEDGLEQEHVGVRGFSERRAEVERVAGEEVLEVGQEEQRGNFDGGFRKVAFFLDKLDGLRVRRGEAANADQHQNEQLGYYAEESLSEARHHDRPMEQRIGRRVRPNTRARLGFAHEYAQGNHEKEVDKQKLAIGEVPPDDIQTANLRKLDHTVEQHILEGSNRSRGGGTTFRYRINHRQK